jgi:Zn-finger nucleic acid-binding protein
VITDRQGIEIDFCPTCRGVWLDRGELDKLIERSAAADSRQGRRRDADEYRGDFDDDYDDDRDSRDRRPGQRKRKSLLGDIFDFGG